MLLAGDLLIIFSSNVYYLLPSYDFAEHIPVYELHCMTRDTSADLTKSADAKKTLQSDCVSEFCAILFEFTAMD